jgi:hypothetical protein
VLRHLACTSNDPCLGQHDHHLFYKFNQSMLGG